MNLTRRLTTAVASGALLFSSFATPVFASEIVISGNGQNSTSNADVNLNQTTTVVQNNSANITNNVDADAKTGGNSASGNNGGDVTVSTGNATTNVSVDNSANANIANVDCCPAASNVSVNISGNAQNTTNDATLNWTNNNTVFQDNNANFNNDIDTDAKTGYNDANGNNGGSVTINTGNASTNVSVNNSANINSARIGGGGEGGGTLSLRIVDNAQNSTNNIVANLLSDAVVTQYNNAYISNDIDADAKTGGNDANGNNGGDVTIDTGNATNKVSVDNRANFNHVDLDCGCLLAEDWLAKIAGNGQNSENNIYLALLSSQLAFQDNWAGVHNDVDTDAKTGHNDADGNNAGSEGDTDPTVNTGNANSTTDLETRTNLNHVGGGSPFPELPEGVSWSFHLDLLGLWALLTGVV